MSATAILDDILEPLASCLDESTARRISMFRIAPAVQQRIEVLGDRANDVYLTTDERAEYEAILDVTDIVAILKLKVRKRLSSTTVRQAPV